MPQLFEETDLPEAANQQSKPHYQGHRGRLRKRFLTSGPDALQDYELIELILFSAIPRKDVKPLAKTLLAKFGTLQRLLNAEIKELQATDGISETTAIFLKTISALAHKTMKMDLMNKPILNSWTRLIDYCQTTMAHETKEHFRILFLNKKNELIADEIQNSGTVDHTQAYPREIMKRALDLGATALILVHNHPSGDPRPSEADVEMTKTIIRAGEPFSIIIHDHIVVSRNGYSSFKSLGLM